MATTGVLADFGRLPTERKALLFIVVGLVFGAIYFRFVFRSLNDDLEEQRNDNDAKIAMNKKLADDIPKYEQLKTHMKELRQVIDENQKALPTETELPAFFETINRKLTESGAELIRTAKQPEENLEGFVKVPIEMEIQGSFLQIKRFFASLSQKDMGAVQVKDDNGVEERERIISIENVSLTQPHVVNGIVVLNAKFTAETFRQEDAPPPPAPAPGQPAQPAGAKPATPAGQGSGAKPPTSAPMPSAATPAGAKARVDSAIDKADKKDRNAQGVDEAKTPAAGSGSDKLKGGL